MRLFSIILCFLFLSSCNRPLDSQRSFQIASGSMAPTLWGPRYQTHCTNCGSKAWILADAFDPSLPVLCSYCGASVTRDNRLTPGDIANVKPISLQDSLTRFDIVVVESDHRDNSNFPCVKRIWAMPGERIELRDGDAWINGRRYQKTHEEFSKVCVPISHYPEDSCSHWYFQTQDPRSTPSDPKGPAIESIGPQQLRITPNQSIQFRYQQLQRVESKWQLAESPINDDCPFNQNNTSAIHLVDDYLVRIEFGDSTTKLWNTQNDETRKSLSLSYISKHSHSNPHLIRCNEWLIVGLCDGRLLAASDLEDHQWDLESLGKSPANTSHRIQIANQSELDLSIARLFVARDLWLGSRQPRQDAWVPMSEETDGYFLLGDNLAISNDSRNADFGRIHRDRISGIVKHPR